MTSCKGACFLWLIAFAAMDSLLAEAPNDEARLARVEERRKKTYVICHRGAAEFAHENTLEAYRAALELGADGNEIDIRATKDGVLVCFHDDMLDQILAAFGDVSDYRWEELQPFRFRDPKQFGGDCRIPTLEEVFALHKREAALLHLDIKRPDLDEAIAALLNRFDLWQHVVACNAETGGVILKDPRYQAGRYKGGLYLDRGEVFPEAIAAVLARPGEGVIVDDPRGVAVALGRKLRPPSKVPVAPRPQNRRPPEPPRSEAELVTILEDAGDWNQVPKTDAEQAKSAARILARARAAEEMARSTNVSTTALAALEARVQRRSLHPDWRYHGLDGAAALHTLITLKAPGAAELGRDSLWRDDPELAPVVNPKYQNPRSWTDFRVKMVVFPALAKIPGEATENVCRAYLALSDEAAAAIGPPQFEQAAHALLAISPREETARELLGHRLQVVRGRAILDCLRTDADWARAALQRVAPHALRYDVLTRIGEQGR